jgi:subtilisin family serine protease
MPSVSPREDRPRTRSNLWFAFLIFCSIVLLLGLWLRPAHANEKPPTVDNINEYCENRPSFRRTAEPLRGALIAKCEGEQRRRAGYDPLGTDVVPPVETTAKIAKNIAAEQPRSTSARPKSGVPAADEHRFAPGEVLVEFSPGVSLQTADAITGRERLQRLASQPLPLSGTTMYRYRIKGKSQLDGKRSVGAVIAALEAVPRIVAVQPNYLYTLQGERTGALTEAQYIILKMRLTEAHTISNGAKTLVAVIDSGIDRNHPELLNVVKDSFDAGGVMGEPAVHGTAVAGIIAAHDELMGVAPQARILAVRTFNGTDAKVAMHGTTYDILPGIEWSVQHGARIVNMSFAGPPDPALSRELADGTRRGVIFIAAVGNEGRSAKPLYPAADENVIAVTATDRSDGVFKDASNCPATCVAAPGVDVLVAEPGDAYGFLSGTSMAAAHVSGVVALLLDAKPDLDLKGIRDLLFKKAKHLNPGDPDQASVAGIVDALESLKAAAAPPAPEVAPVASTPPGVVATKDASPAATSGRSAAVSDSAGRPAAKDADLSQNAPPVDKNPTGSVKP